MYMVYLKNVRNVRFQEMIGEKKGLGKTQACNTIQRKTRGKCLIIL